MSEEYIQISAFLSPEQIEALDRIAKRAGVRGRQVPLRWAVHEYLLSKDSTYRTIHHEQDTEAESD